MYFFFFSSRRRHTRSLCDWSSDVCSSDLTGTRFGKFIQLAAASTIEEKFSDAAQVHAVTGACPTMALHVQWDLPNGSQDAGKVKELAKKHGVKPGSINPNVFQDQEYKYGSLGNPDESIRRKALTHT